MAFPAARRTTYRGIEMRSRLEAWYAAYLDQIEADWTYEPMAFGNGRGQYLPDFERRFGDSRFFIEVKPTLATAQRILERMEIILDSVPDAVLVVEAVDDNGYYVRWPEDGRWRWELRRS